MLRPSRDVRKEWAAEQLELKSRLITYDDLDFSLDGSRGELRLIGGVDISFVKGNEVDACAILVILSYPELKVLHSSCRVVALTQPYVPGFLAFREVPFLCDLVEDLRRTSPELVPQVIFVDGNGVLHQRGFGLASHLSVLTGIPTIGVGKTFYHIEGLTEKEVRRRASEVLQKAGDAMPIEGDSGKVWGVALRCTDDSVKPVYISVGSRISLDTAVELVRRCCIHRVPEPVRQADLMSREYLRLHPVPARPSAEVEKLDEEDGEHPVASEDRAAVAAPAAPRPGPGEPDADGWITVERKRKPARQEAPRRVRGRGGYRP